MRTLLLTGGTGFFGKSILDAFHHRLLEDFDVGRIVVVARRASRLLADAPWLCNEKVELVDADILQLDSTLGADVVIHAAASSDAQRYREDPIGEARIIVDGTRRLCEIAARSPVRPRLLYISSGAVYGRQPSGMLRLDENAGYFPDADPVKAAYSDAKRSAENVVRQLAAFSGIPARIARCFAFVGPWLPRDGRFAIGNFLGDALRGKPIRVLASHPVIRSYLHADDLAVWLLRLATAEGEGCEVYNVGSDEAVSIRDLAALVATIAGVGVLLPEMDSRRAEGILESTDRYVPDVTKAHRELGLAVTIPLPEAIERTLRVLCAN